MTSRGAVALVLACGVVGAGCASPDGPPAVGDCSSQLRTDGTAYTSYGWTSRNAVEHSAAERASCADVGEDGDSVAPQERAQIYRELDGPVRR